VQSTRYVRSSPQELLVNGEYLRACLPHSKLDILDADQFVWEEAAD
jgi:hypothetical protein